MPVWRLYCWQSSQLCYPINSVTCDMAFVLLSELPGVLSEKFLSLVILRPCMAFVLLSELSGVLSDKFLSLVM